MAQFSNNSIGQLGTAHPALVKLMQEVLKKVDISILKGYRGEREQNIAFKNGASKLKFPMSKHNNVPSLAVDIAPYPIDWNNHKRFVDLAKIVFETWDECKINNIINTDYSLRWGGNWKDYFDNSWKLQKFSDKPHFELFIKSN